MQSDMTEKYHSPASDRQSLRDEQFEQLVTRLSPRLMDMGREFFGSGMEAEEVVQETWLRAWNVREAVELTEPYVMRIARNVCISMWRGHRPTVELDVVPTDNQISAVTPQEEAEEHENSEWLTMQVRRLPQAEREVWSMFYDQGLTVEEIAVARGCNVRSVRNTLSKVRTKLRSDIRRRFITLRKVLFILLTALGAGATVTAVIFNREIATGVKNVAGIVFDLPVDTLIYRNVEQMPTFGASEADLYVYISEHLHYPESAIVDSIEGRVVVLFVVEMDGSISHVDIRRSPDPRLSAEAIRFLSEMPPWHPARRRGQIVRCMYALPIVFRLN